MHRLQALIRRKVTCDINCVVQFDTNMLDRQTTSRIQSVNPHKKFINCFSFGCFSQWRICHHKPILLTNFGSLSITSFFLYLWNLLSIWFYPRTTCVLRVREITIFVEQRVRDRTIKAFLEQRKRNYILDCGRIRNSNPYAHIMDY